MKLTSTFAILDVMKGRKDLARALENGETISIQITGTITTPWGGDDGESQEFEVSVETLKASSDKAA